MFKENEWIRPEQLEQWLGISVKHQGNLRSQRKIPFSKRGNYVFYHVKKIQEWLEDASIPAMAS